MKWALWPVLASASSNFTKECPKLWHYDEEYDTCRPGIEHVDLQCSGDLIQVNFNNIIFNDENNITVNSCTKGFEITGNDHMKTIRIRPEVCEADIHFEDDEIILRNTIKIKQDDTIYSIPFDCVFQRSNDEFPNMKKKNSKTRDRRDAIASSHSAFEINLEYVDSIFHNPLPSERRLIVGEDANVKIGLKQRIPGIEMAITNCTVFDSSYSQSYSVIDYPRCPDDIVKADIPSGSDQWENRLTYRVFEFVNAELDTSLMKLVCRVILCDASLDQSECRSTCGLK